MKKIFVLFVAVFCLLLASVAAYAVGSCTVALTEFKTANPNLRVVTIACTADAEAATVPNVTTATVDGYITGWYITEVRTYPDGVATPTNLYDLVLNDSDGFDVMGGTLANRLAASAQRALPLWTTGLYADIPVYGTLTMVTTNNAVNSAKFTVKIFLRKY